MQIYHSNTTEIAVPKLKTSARNGDFGKGIYMYEEKDQARLQAGLLARREALPYGVISIFETPIGFEYLRDLQKILLSGGVKEELIKPIPLYTTFKRIDLKHNEKVKTRVTQAQKKEMSLKMKYRNAVLIAVILGVLCLAMLLITLHGTTPNAINYKNAITNQYAEWEQSLKEREAAVREKERELNIEP